MRHEGTGKSIFFFLLFNFPVFDINIPHKVIEGNADIGLKRHN